MRPDYRANLIHLGWCKSSYLLQHHMLGLTTEQKLLITPPYPQGWREADSSQPDPVQGPLKSVQAPSAPVGLGSGPQWALSQLCCQNTKPFSIGFASLVWYMCEGAWGRGGKFLRVCVFSNWGIISPLPACGLCAKGKEAGDLFPEAISSPLQHPSRGWMCPSQGPLGPQNQLNPLSVLQKGKSGVMGGHQYRALLTTPSWNKRRPDKTWDVGENYPSDTGEPAILV